MIGDGSDPSTVCGHGRVEWDAKVCVRDACGRAQETVTTWGSTTNQILALRERLIAAQVRCVVMEATGDYWKPFYYLLEDLDGVDA